MKIDLVTNDGSPCGPTCKTIYGDHVQKGCGGSELALLTICEGLHNRGNQVTLYNDPQEPDASPFEQKRIAQFNPSEPRDFLIIFRSPNIRSVPVTNCKKIWWSCDQNTIGGFENFGKTVDQIVLISPYHADFFKKTYNIVDKAIVTDLPVRTWEYEQPIERVKHKFLFASVPDRGLNNLCRMWPLIQREITDATLVITSDYSLWGKHSPLNEQFKSVWAGKTNVQFVGAINRKELIQHQLSSDMLTYPCDYPENFCITVAEASVSGCYPVTTNIAALPTTNMGTVVSWDARDARGDAGFVQIIKDTLNDPNYEQRRLALQKKAIERFNLDTILNFWEQNILV